MTRVNATACPIRMKKRAQSWAVFDALPREVRDALNYAAFKYSAGKCPPSRGAAFAKRIIETDAKQVAASYAQRDAQEELKELGL